MADSSVKSSSKKNKKKRQLNSTEPQDQPPKPYKTQRIDSSETIEVVEESTTTTVGEEGGPWRNLQLIFSIENSDSDIKKLDLAFDFVNSRLKEEADNGINEDNETVKTSRLIVYLNNWIQSFLVSSNKKACLDYRCWIIFKFCLDKSLKLHLSLSFSKNLLRTIASVARHALSLLNDFVDEANDHSVQMREFPFTDEQFEWFRVVVESVSLIFLSDGSMLNDNSDLWVSVTDPVFQLVHKICEKNLAGSNLGALVLQLSCFVLEPFAKFLKVRPTKKDGFHGFVDKLLEPLLHSLGVLNLQIHGSNNGLVKNVMKLIQEVLSQGLFHPSHIDGFLAIHSMEKNIALDDCQFRDSKTVIRSYHRHLFDKLEKIVATKKILVMTETGELFRLLADCVRRQRSLVQPEGGRVSRHVEDNSSGHMSNSSNNTLEEKSFGLSNWSTPERKSLFDFFIQIMEPLLLEMNGYLQANLEMGPSLFDAHCVMKSINKLLASLMRENVYLRTEDPSEGAFCNYLKKVYKIIISFSPNLLQWSKQDIIEGKQKESFYLLAEEIIISVGYFLNIEYQVIENDLESLWLMIISYLSISSSFLNEPENFQLTSLVLNLGCQVVKLYSELRQVKYITFALCKAIRAIICSNTESNYASYLPSATSLPYQAYARSVGMLLSSSDCRIAFHNAVKAIPEGQASECIEQLAMDLSETVEWMRIGCPATGEKDFGQNFEAQAELLGKGLSEIYTLVLESLTVTTGNSYLLAISLKDLTTVVRTCMSSLVNQELSIDRFLVSVAGRTLEKVEISCHWVFAFFFRVYVSWRSLCWQAISAMPPRKSKEMSKLMGYSFAAYSGRDCIDRDEWSDDGYFSWIAEGSASLLQIIQSISNYFEDRLTNCCPLIYIFNSSALQRLVDLNRQIKSLEYLLQNNDYLVQNKLLDGAGLSVYRKRNKRREKHIQYLKKEAIGLTEFILNNLTSVDDNQLPTSNSDDAIHGDACIQGLHESCMWNLGISAHNEKSLPTAIWWILCQSFDIWSVHASKKNLKMFLSILIRTSFSSPTNSCVNASETGRLNKVTVHQISSALLRDTILYEHNFVRRRFASMFCHILEKFSVPLFCELSVEPVDFSSLPDWAGVLESLEKKSMLGFPKTTLISCSSEKPPTKIYSDKKSNSFTACQSLLSLMFQMPKGYFDSKSVSLYVTYILNFERLLLGSLLDCQGVFSSHEYELLRLFVSCRRSLKWIITALFQEKTQACKTSMCPILVHNSFLIQWLFKSVYMVVGRQETDSEGYVCEARDIIFSLMDQTMYVCLMLNKYQFTNAVPSELISEDHSPSDFLNNAKPWRSAVLIAENLKELAESLLVPLNDGISSEERRVDITAKKLNKLSSIISCFGGFLWSLASAVSLGDHKGNTSMWKHEAVTELKQSIIVFADLISSFLRILVTDDAEPGTFGDSGAIAISCEERNQQSETPTTCPVKDTAEDESKNGFGSRNSSSVASVLNKVDSYNHKQINRNILQRLLKGEHPEVAFSLKELLVAYSAVLRLNFLINNSSLSSLVPLTTSISEVLLLELVDSDEMPPSFVFVWLDGVLKYLEELGGYFPLANPSLTKNLFDKLIGLHIRGLGKIISFQGKRATLISHETESSTNKLFEDHVGSCETSLSHGLYYLDEFKSRLRTSFKVLVQKSSELHLLSALQAVESALIGVPENFTNGYQITMGSIEGGKVSSVVAAGIDCLDLILENVSGRKRLSLVKEHIQRLIAALFNIVLHLQCPLLFYERTPGREADNSPDSGSVVLMCIEVLTRITGKHALFQMDSWKLGQSLRIPGAVFQDFYKLRCSEAPHPYNSFSYDLDNQDNIRVERTKSYTVNRQFTIELFAACCRFLYTVLKHHKSESERCVALLEGSVRDLLHCLETVQTDLVAVEGCFAWNTQEAVKCASFLRRIYEELGQQKDIYGQHCFKFLASYIWVYSGYGPHKTGIRREVDEALKPGVYALIDACSPNDLQYLHTMLGVGPCRSTLACLQNDYKQNFKYRGKV